MSTLASFVVTVLALLTPSYALPKLEDGRCGDYCSYEHVGEYFGPLDTTMDLQQALDQLSFKREIILSHHGQLEQAYQWLHRWQRFGYGHALLVYPARAHCDHLKAMGALKKVACAWYSTKPELRWLQGHTGNGLGGLADKWGTFLTGARIVRMGYNMLMADADTGPLYDFYRFIHSPPFNTVQLWIQREGTYAVNSGVYYVRGAARDGPVAYLVAEMVLKNVLWMEDVTPLRATLGYGPNDTEIGPRGAYSCNDQLSISDQVHAGITGMPWFMECFFHIHRNQDPFMLNLTRILQRTGQGGPRAQGPYDEWVVEVPPELRLGSGGKVNCTIHTAPLRIPHYRGQYTVEYGWYPFNRRPDGRRQLGPMGQHVHDLLTSDGPGPPFVEPEDPASASVVDAMPLERFAFFPPWLLTTHGQGEHNRGRSGWWADHLVGAPISTMLHLHAGLMNTDHNKLLYTILEMPLGWDYDLAEAAEKRPPYISTRAHGHVPPLVALAPGVVHSAMGEAEFVKLLQGVFRVATSLHRTVVWPWVPCEAPMLRATDARHDPTTNGHRLPFDDYVNITRAVPYALGVKSLKDGLQCMVLVYELRHCMLGGTRPEAPHSAPRGLLPYEFDHWYRRQQQQRQQAGGIEPGPHNTLQDLLSAGGQGATTTPVPPITVTKPQLASLASHPTAAHVPVLWLRGPVEVPELPSPEHNKLYDKVLATCCVLGMNETFEFACKSARGHLEHD